MSLKSGIATDSLTKSEKMQLLEKETPELLSLLKVNGCCCLKNGCLEVFRCWWLFSVFSHIAMFNFYCSISSSSTGSISFNFFSIFLSFFHLSFYWVGIARENLGSNENNSGNDRNVLIFVFFFCFANNQSIDRSFAILFSLSSSFDIDEGISLLDVKNETLINYSLGMPIAILPFSILHIHSVVRCYYYCCYYCCCYYCCCLLLCCCLFCRPRRFCCSLPLLFYFTSLSLSLSHSLTYSTSPICSIL